MLDCCALCGFELDQDGECDVCASGDTAVPLAAVIRDIVGSFHLEYLGGWQGAGIIEKVREALDEADFQAAKRALRRRRVDRRRVLRGQLHEKRVRVKLGGQTIVSMTELQLRAWARLTAGVIEYGTMTRLDRYNPAWTRGNK